jgi:hypothetical protein
VRIDFFTCSRGWFFIYVLINLVNCVVYSHCFNVRLMNLIEKLLWPLL